MPPAGWNRKLLVVGRPFPRVTHTRTNDNFRRPTNGLTRGLAKASVAKEPSNALLVGEAFP